MDLPVHVNVLYEARLSLFWRRKAALLLVQVQEIVALAAVDMMLPRVVQKGISNIYIYDRSGRSQHFMSPWANMELNNPTVELLKRNFDL